MTNITDLTAKTKREIRDIVERRASDAYDSGPGWGKAADRLVSVHKRHFLTEDDIAAIEQAKKDAYARLADRVVPMDKNALNRDGWMSKYSEEPMDLPQGFKDRYPGVTFAVEGLGCRYARGRRIYDLLPPESARIRLNGTVSRGWRVGAEKRFAWGTDEQGRRYVDFIVWPVSEEIPEASRRRNWAREGKRREFKKAAVDLVQGLADSGYELKSVVEQCRESVCGGETIKHVEDWYILFEQRQPAAETQPVAKRPATAEPVPGPGVSGPSVSVCFTGALPSMGRREAAYRATKAGMKVCSSVSAGLTYLVTADMSSESGKSVKAQELGVERIDERRFLAMLAEKGA